MFLLDGISYDDCARITSLVEKFDILSGKNSGRSQDGSMYIEVIGTYFNYTVTFKRKNIGTYKRWDEFKNHLAQPDNRHTISILHDQGMMTDYPVYVSGGQRELKHTKKISETMYESEWGDLTIDFTAMDKIDPSILEG